MVWILNLRHQKRSKSKFDLQHSIYPPEKAEEHQQAEG